MKHEETKIITDPFTGLCYVGVQSVPSRLQHTTSRGPGETEESKTQ